MYVTLYEPEVYAAETDWLVYPKFFNITYSHTVFIHVYNIFLVLYVHKYGNIIVIAVVEKRFIGKVTSW